MGHNVPLSEASLYSCTSLAGEHTNHFFHRACFFPEHAALKY